MRSTCGGAARWARRIAIAVGVFCATATGAHAAPITYTFTGTGTGTLGATPFTGAAFTIVAAGDTTGVTSSAGLFCNHLTSVSFAINGFAPGSITDPLDIFDNTTLGGLGLQQGAACPGGLDWLDSPLLAAFTTYRLDTAVGPVALGSLSPSLNSLSTSVGAFSFTSTSAATFQATLGSPHVGAGELDPTFGTAGRAVIAADPAQNNYAYVNALVVQPDARIVMLGYANADGGSLYRLTAYGGLDASFGAGGRADARVPSPFGLALQPDGKFVVGGSSSIGFALTRINADGTADLSYGSGGSGVAECQLGPLGGYARKLLLQPDGKIIAIGMTSNASSTTYNAIGVARFLPNGSLDTTFGAGGRQIYAADNEASVVPWDAALQNDGKIIIVGFKSDSTTSPVLLRYTSAGQIDGGFTTTAPGTMGFQGLYGVGVQADGKVVISGGGSTNVMHTRLNADGTPDGSYGTAGVAAIPVSGYSGYGMGLILQPDGKVLSLWQDGSPNPLPRIIRLTTAGTLDASFGSGGMTATPMTNPTYPRSLALQPDGKILMAGEVRFSTGIGTGYVAHYGFLRYQGDQITGTIVEYFNTILGHYFITASAAEQASIDAGGSGPGWTRTGYTFRSGGVSRACRFYGTPGVGPNSHFYTIDPAECALVKTDPGWHFESYDFSATPPGTGNSCGSGSVQVYRAYNHRFAQNDSNHRYTTDLPVYNAQVAAGWTGEGVVFCAPL